MSGVAACQRVSVGLDIWDLCGDANVERQEC